tara:strand:+ start:4792 stop:5574 length:783 start_codon:yes stop_codon:yes gene_type:complete
MSIHETAIISSKAKIAESASIGPFTVIVGDVEIGEGTVVDSNVRIGNDYGRVVLGKNNHLFHGCVVGEVPQDLKYKNENTELIIGDNNRIRECATLNTGTVGGGGKTVVGDGNLFMAYSHVGHDCLIGNSNVIANAVSIAGHVIVQDKVTVGGMSGLSQFITIGSYAFVAGFSCLNKDVLPFAMASGNWATMRATNKIGMERGGYDKESVQAANQILRVFTKSGLRREEAIDRIEKELPASDVRDLMLEFAKKSERGLAI